MDRLTFEKLVDEVYDLRQQRKSIQNEINEKVAKLTTYLHSIDKQKAKTKDYSIELTQRTKHWYNLNKEDSARLQREGKLKVSQYDRLMIASHKNIELVDGKWVYK